MKQREQALLLLSKAAQDEALLDAVADSELVSDEIFGFHCQQAAEKMIKALLSSLGVQFRRTHDIASLMEHFVRLGIPIPLAFENLATFTPFGALYRYEAFDSASPLDRTAARNLLRELRTWIELSMKSPE
jgi:HEPN domain-containing protein